MFMTEQERKQISKTWLSGQKSCTLVIPKSIATKYGLDSPSNVIVEETSDGILIRKIKFDWD